MLVVQTDDHWMVDTEAVMEGTIAPAKKDNEHIKMQRMDPVADVQQDERWERTTWWLSMIQRWIMLDGGEVANAHTKNDQWNYKSKVFQRLVKVDQKKNGKVKM